MKLSIVLAGECVSDLFAGLQRLIAVVDGLEGGGAAVETIVVAYSREPDVEALEAAVEGAVFVRPAMQDGTILERWRAGAAEASGDVLWLLGPDSTYDGDRFADHLALVENSVSVAYSECQALIRAAAVPLLDDDAETPATAYREGDAVAAIAERARRRRVRAVEVPLALPAQPFDEGWMPLVTARAWTGATIYEAVEGVVRTGRRSGADYGTVIRTWYPHQQVVIGNFTHLAAGVHVANPSHGIGPADRVGPHGPRPHIGHNVNTAAIAQMSLHVPAIQHRYADPLRATPLTIGHDVWIGSRAIVVGNLTIGSGAVLSAGAVVLGDVPPYAVVEGNPAKVVRMRFSPAVVESLLRICWWDWDEQTIAARADWFTRPINDFCNRFDPLRLQAKLSAPSENAVPQPA